jgi:hypothetical protein
MLEGTAMSNRQLALLTVTGVFWFFTVCALLLGRSLDYLDLLAQAQNMSLDGKQDILVRLLVPAAFGAIALTLTISLVRAAPAFLATVGLGLLALVLIGQWWGYPIVWEVPDQLPLGDFLTLGLGVVCAILWVRRVISRPTVGDGDVSA